MSDNEKEIPPSSPEPDTPDENFLGDPNAYYHSLLSKPLPKEVSEYLIKRHKLNTEEKYINYLQSADFIEEISEFDYLLFFEQVLHFTVKDFHRKFAAQVYADRAITLAPRGVGKSHFFSVCLSIWLAFYQKSKFTMILSETEDQAKRILEEIKQIIEDNEALKDALMIEKTSKDSVWNKNEVKLKNDCIIKVKSFTAKLRGNHPNSIILDDVLSNQNSLTKQQREDLFNYYAQTIRPMATKNARILFVGTAQHKDDLLHKLGASSSFKFLKLKAYDEETAESIWPEQLPEHELEDYRKTYGIVSFEKEFQNNPMSDKLSLFPLYILEKCLDERASYVKDYYGSQKVFLGADFSMPGTNQGDYTVISTARMDGNGTLTLLNYDRYRDSPENQDMFVDKQIETISRFCRQFNVTLGMLESNSFQKIYSDFFKKKTNLPLKSNVVTRSGKNSLQSGIPALRILMENGKIKFPYKTAEDRLKTEEIIREFNGLVMTEDGRISNQTSHDDIPMSWLHLLAATHNVAQMTTFVPSDKLLKSSRSHNLIGRRKKRF